MTPPDLWRTNPWLTSHMIGAAHGQGIAADQQERGHAVYAALSERSAATIAAAGRQQKIESDETQRPEAALSDWEDEGGSTAGRASPEDVQAASGRRLPQPTAQAMSGAGSKRSHSLLTTA